MADGAASVWTTLHLTHRTEAVRLVARLIAQAVRPPDDAPPPTTYLEASDV